MLPLPLPDPLTDTFCRRSANAGDWGNSENTKKNNRNRAFPHEHNNSSSMAEL